MTTTLRLYEATDALDVVREWLYEHDDEIRAMEGALPDELAALLHEAEGDFKTKVERVGLFIRELIANANAVKAEEERLSLRRKHYEKSAEGLKGYLLMEMQRAEIPKVEGKLVTVRVQKSPPSVQSSLTPDELRSIEDTWVQIVPESRRLNSAAVIAHWKATEESPIDGVTVSQKAHVRIV